jgi:RES domain-containing protein
MPIKPHPRFDEIKGVLEKLSERGKPFASICFRCVDPKFADQAVTGLGSQIYGAR